MTNNKLLNNIIISGQPKINCHIFFTVSYVKALDIWMGSCTAFVFLALVEFTVVNHLARHHRRFLFWGSTYARQTITQVSTTNEDSINNSYNPQTSGKSPLMKTRDDANLQLFDFQSSRHCCTETHASSESPKVSGIRKFH